MKIPDKELFWEKIELSSTHTVLEWCQKKSFKGISDSQGSLGFNLSWLSTFLLDSEKKLIIFLLQRDSQTIGFIPFLRYSERLPVFTIGSMKVLSVPVIRYASMGMPLFCSSLDAEDRKRHLASLWSSMRKVLEANSVFFMESIPQSSEFHEWISTDLSFLNHFIFKPYGPLYQHRFIHMEGSYEGYLKHLSSKTRSDLNRTRKRFMSLNPEWIVRSYRNPNEVEEFLEHAIAISRETWQFKMAGGGLRNHKILRERFYQTATEGWFRSYILLVKEEPVAFQVGHLFEGNFLAQEIGYGPRWAKQQVGIFLHTEIIQDLCSNENTVNVFDFGNTDTVHKQRLSNFSRKEGFVYLLPNNLRGKFLGMCMNLNQEVSNLALKVANYFKIKEIILKKINPH